MSKAVKQHYVPKVYLKNFCVNKKLWVLDIEKVRLYPNVQPRLTSTTEVCNIEYFYSIDDDFVISNPEYNTLDKNHIEYVIFNRLENMYGRNLFLLLSQCQEIDRSSAENVAEFVIQMKIRNPFYRNVDLKRNGHRLLTIAKEKLQKDSYHNEKFLHIPIKIKDVLLEEIMAPKEGNVNFERNLQLSSLIKREDDKGFSSLLKEAILNHPWTILETRKSWPNFITTDNPGVSIKLSEPENTFNTCFKDDFRFYFPISPKYCLFIDGSFKDVNCYNNPFVKKINRQVVDPLTVISINDKIMQVCNKFIIGDNRDYLNQIAVKNKVNN